MPTSWTFNPSQCPVRHIKWLVFLLLNQLVDFTFNAEFDQTSVTRERLCVNRVVGIAGLDSIALL